MKSIDAKKLAKSRLIAGEQKITADPRPLLAINYQERPKEWHLGAFKSPAANATIEEVVAAHPKAIRIGLVRVLVRLSGSCRSTGFTVTGVFFTKTQYATE